MSRLSICRPAVFSLLLWHVTQYLLRVSAAGSGDVPRPAVVAAPCAARALTYRAPAKPMPNRANKAGSAREWAGRAGISGPIRIKYALAPSGRALQFAP